MVKKQTDNHYKTEPVFLLIDEPVGSIDEDILNLRPFADVIAGAALGTKGPFTIGVYADWGEGKTSVLRLARELVEKNNPDIVTVWFNAWQYGKEDHPIIPLVATIAKSVSEKLKTVDKGKKELRAGLSKMSAALRAIAYGFSAKGKVSVPGFGELEAGFVAKEMIDRYDQLQRGDDPLIEKTLYYNAFELLENIAKDVGDEIEAPQIAVFIDDLDRCNPPEAIKLLESIKLVLSQKGFVFALALDKRILQGFLKFRYETEFKVADYQTGGKDYLDKIIQLPLPLLPHEGRFEEYITQLLASNTALNHESNQPVKAVISELQGVLSKGARFNPRNLVRFLNNLIVDRLLWKTVEKEEAGVEVMGLCVISRILRDHFKDDRLYEYLWRNQDVCDRIREFVLKEEPESEKGRLGEEREGKEAGGQPTRAQEIIDKLRQMEFLQDVLQTALGRLWLEDGNKRNSVNQFIVEQRKEEEEQAEELKDDEKIFDEAIRKKVNVEKGAITDELYRGIKVLNLASSGLKILPAVIGKLTALQDLRLYANQLTTVPEAIGKLTALRALSLGNNPLTIVPEAIGKLTALQTLKLYNNQLTIVPETICELAALKELRLDDNQLTSVPESICKLTALEKLNLGNNQLTGLTETIWELTNLQTLYLNRNQLTTVPKAIVKLTNLQDLSLSHNPLTIVPEAIFKLTGLQTLRLSGNQLTVPEAIGKLKALQTLYLNRNQLTIVPKAIFKLTALQTLYLKGNQLTTIPEAICKLTNLQTLSLSHNQLATVSEAIFKLTALQRLDLDSNQLTIVPEAIGKLNGLLNLNLGNNQLTDLPEEIGKLTALKELYLYENQLTTLPKAIGELSNLKWLSLKNNKFSEEEKARLRELLPENCKVYF